MVAQRSVQKDDIWSILYAKTFIRWLTSSRIHNELAFASKYGVRDMHMEVLELRQEYKLVSIKVHLLVT